MALIYFILNELKEEVRFDIVGKGNHISIQMVTFVYSKNVFILEQRIWEKYSRKKVSISFSQGEIADFFTSSNFQVLGTTLTYLKLREPLWRHFSVTNSSHPAYRNAPTSLAWHVISFCASYTLMCVWHTHFP